MQSPSLVDLFNTGTHFGHKSELTHPKFKKYVYTIKDGINIINLEKTKQELDKSVDFIKKLLLENKKIIFVGTKKQAKDVIKETAEKSGMPYINYRWLGGTLTNFETIKKRIDSFNEMSQKLSDKNTKFTHKKERLMIEKEVAKPDKFFRGIKDIKSKPDALFVIDPNEDHVAVSEAKKINIPVIALCNTNTNLVQIDYPIPANDNAPKTIRLICDYIAETITKNKKK